MDTFATYPQQLSPKHALKYAQMPVGTTRMLIGRQTTIQTPPPILPPPGSAPSPIILMGALNASFVVRATHWSIVRNSHSCFTPRPGRWNPLRYISIAPDPCCKLTPSCRFRHPSRPLRNVLLHPPHLPKANTMVHTRSRMRHVRHLHSRHWFIHKTIYNRPMGATPAPTTILYRQNAPKGRVVRNQQVRPSFLLPHSR
jgi:hypothetical protein